jgi:3'-5' exoribonuclease
MTDQTILRKKRSLADLGVGDEFSDELFLIEEVKRRETKAGAPYYIVTLRDSSGAVDGRVWDHIDAFEKRGYARDQYVQAAGQIGEYNGKRDATIRSMRPVSEDQVDPADFIAVSHRDPAEMEREFRALIASVSDDELRGLLEKIFHPQGKLWVNFREAPSARMVHQAYLHGLLEHTINVANNARALGTCYGQHLDIGLLTTGALIHDMGKTVEFRWKPRIDYTDMGYMMGHISIGSNMLHDFAREVPMAAGKLAHLHHMVLSHHGKQEWGSPRTPATPEALILHYADYADAQMGIYEEESKAAQQRGDTWTSYNKFIERRLYAGGSTFKDERLPGEYADDLARLMAQALGHKAERPQD